MTITAPDPTTGYSLDSAWHAERARLDSLTALYDPTTLALCERLGLESGWRCLDVGAGTGTLAQVLAERVAPSGSVVALDVDTRFLDPLAGPHLASMALDVTQRPLPTAEFDLVHARLLLEHLPARDEVLASMIRSTKPGGWVLVEDFDSSTALVIDPPSNVHSQVAKAIRLLFTHDGYDPLFGRSLPRRLRAAGAGGREHTRTVDPGRCRSGEWRAAMGAPGRPARSCAVGRGPVGQEDLDAFHALLHDGHTVCFAPLMVSCSGRVSAPLA